MEERDESSGSGLASAQGREASREPGETAALPDDRSDGAGYKFDLFVVYATSDVAFVRAHLLPALGLPAERVLLVDHLRPGELLVAELERGVLESRYIVPVLSPAYLRDKWAIFGEQLASHLSAANPRVIPLLLEDCELPLRVTFRVPVDCRVRENWPEQFGRLRRALQGAPGPLDMVTEVSPPPRRRWWMLAALAGLLGLGAFWRLHRKQVVPQPLPSWLLDDFVPTVRNAERLGQDLGTQSGDYLESSPSSAAVFQQQVADLGFAIDQYNRACREFRIKSDAYRVHIGALGPRDGALKDAVATLFAYASSQLSELPRPEVDPHLPAAVQHQALVADWRAFETTSSGPFRRMATDLARVETEVFRASGLRRPECPWELGEGPSGGGSGDSSSAPPVPEPLAAYGTALRGLADAVDAFSKAELRNTDDVRAAARPLKAAILQNNDAYARVSARRLALELEVLRDSPTTSAAAPVVCVLDEVDGYQLQRLNPLFNGLLVNVIAAWRDALPEAILARIRAQQQSGWRELHETLLLGVAAFSARARIRDGGHGH